MRVAQRSGSRHIAFEITSIATRWDAIGHSGLAWRFLLPLWLTVGLLAFIYLAGLHSEYQFAFRRAEFTTGRRRSLRWALIASCGVQSHKLHSFVNASAYRLTSGSTFADARSTRRQARRIRGSFAQLIVTLTLEDGQNMNES